MKTVIFVAVLSIGTISLSSFRENPVHIASMYAEKFDIKIKNDIDKAVKVINAGSGGSYSLTKGATTTIKMEEGDKLHYYENGKKGTLILVASKEMHGKVQLLSKF